MDVNQDVYMTCRETQSYQGHVTMEWQRNALIDVPQNSLRRDDKLYDFVRMILEALHLIKN